MNPFPKKLTQADLDRIYQKFVQGKHQLHCNETHSHGFNCVKFQDEETMIIERLRVEVVLLRKKLADIASIIK